MTSAVSSVRALLVYALVLPMALIMGYLLASPSELGTWAMVAMVLMVLATPIILAKHHAVLFLSWNMTAMAFFLPGQPHFWLVMAGLSLFISLFQRALSSQMRFISPPSIVWPLVYLAIVVVVTARLNGGFGLRIFGSDNIGGRRYFMILASIAGFVAMTAHAVPEGKSMRYVGLFFLGGLVNSLGTLLPFLGPSFYFLFLFLPAEGIGVQEMGFEPDIIRFWGSSVAAMGVLFYLLARNGIRGSLSLKNPMRPLLILGLVAIGSAGGFRTYLILMVLTFLLLFYFEGLVRSRYMFSLSASVLLICACLVPLAHKLPLSIQRALTVLPLNLDPVAEYDARGSSEWRLEMWRTLIAEVPHYVWLGKGLSISRRDIELMGALSRRGAASSQEVSILTGDYHSGPLSVIIPFGIWGIIGVVWFMAASIRALYLNYLYGDEALKKINTFLLAYFLARLTIFSSVFGGFYADLAIFTGIVGLSVSLNHGIRKPAKTLPVEQPKPVAEIELPGTAVPAFSRLQ